MASAVARCGTKVILKPKIAKRAIQAARPALRKCLGKKAAKRFTKSIFSKIPILSTAFGFASGFQRLVCDTDDPHRVWKAGAEVISGFIANIPGAGSLVSYAVDVSLLVADLSQGSQGKMEIENEPPVRVNAQNYNVTGNNNSTVTFGNGNQVGARTMNPAINYQQNP